MEKMAATMVTLPARLGNYELTRLIAKGGMADIYLATPVAGPLATPDGQARPRRVAVKVLNVERAGDGEARAMFVDEARVMGLLDHPALAQVHEVAHEGHAQYMVMEHVHGVDLRMLMQKVDAVDYQAAIAIVIAAAAGLDHAHRRCTPDGQPMHIVHRDVSLSNVMVGFDGAVKVVDFGIARTALSAHCTNPGTVRGKASYMSPEQALGDPLDRRTDIFALGIVLYELTTGRRCFQGSSDFERMLAAVRGEYVAPAEVDPHFPPQLANAIATCLAIDPGQRYASAAALADALDAIARAYGWVTGPDVIAELMHGVYGDVSMIDTLDVSDSAVCGEEDVPVDEAPVTAPVPVVDDQPVDPDDQPTRGRRTVPKIFSAQFAA